MHCGSSLNCYRLYLRVIFTGYATFVSLCPIPFLLHTAAFLLHFCCISSVNVLFDLFLFLLLFILQACTLHAAFLEQRTNSIRKMNRVFCLCIQPNNHCNNSKIQQHSVSPLSQFFKNSSLFELRLVWYAIKKILYLRSSGHFLPSLIVIEQFSTVLFLFDLVSSDKILIIIISI